MLANELTIHESWNLEKTCIPLRSCLYHLEPIGIATPLVESFTGYIARLAHAHSILPGVLMERELVPFVKKASKNNKSEYLVSRAGVFTRIGTLNSVGAMAANWVEAVETLTLRNDICYLTMLTWAELFPSRGLLRRNWAYCPICYEEWNSSAQVIYEPLIWSINQIKVCLRHRCFLCLQCIRCNQPFPPLGWNSMPGFCPKCQGWLGISSNAKLPNLQNLSEEEWQSQTFIILSIGELIATAPQLSFPLKKEIISKAISNYVNELSEGNIAAFARLLNIPKNTVWMWCTGKALPSIDILVKVCQRLGISILELLKQEVLPSYRFDINNLTQKELPVNTYIKPRRALNIQKIQQILEGFLEHGESPPPSMEEVARCLEYGPRFLRRHFPDLCCAISFRYTTYQQNCYKNKIEQLCLEVRQAAIALYDQGLYPSNTRVSSYLKQPGAIRNKDVRAVLEQIRCQLGIGKNQVNN